MTDLPKLGLSEKKTAEVLDCSPDTVRRMVARGDLERVDLSARRFIITTRSINKLLDSGGPA